MIFLIIYAIGIVIGLVITGAMQPVTKWSNGEDYDLPGDYLNGKFCAGIFISLVWPSAIVLGLLFGAIYLPILVGSKLRNLL